MMDLNISSKDKGSFLEARLRYTEKSSFPGILLFKRSML